MKIWKRLEHRPPVGLLVLCLLACAGPAAGQGLGDSPLRAALVGVPAQIAEGEAFAITVQVANPGPESPMTRATFRLPTSLRLASRPDCGGQNTGWTYEPEGRQWVSEGRWAPDEVRACRVQLIAPDDVGRALLAIDVATFAPDSYGGVQQEVPMVGRPAPGMVYFELAGVRLRAIEIGVILFALLFFGSLLLGRLRRAGFASGYNLFAFGVLCAGFLVYFALLAAGDRRALAEFRETRCEVFDSDVEVNLHRGKTRATESSSFDARLVVAYELDGRRTITLAERPASFLNLDAEKANALLDAVEKAGTIPCWVDPQDGCEVLIARGYGGAYLFALIPLGGLLLIYFLRRK